ncbi:transposase [Cryobacterium arcticum]|uniref:Transposase n=1 Tax=Cryobacterium arcticum TaxID=670052 RepID=A0A317ZWA4_9MICO|nr:transposase [Cryobacterium arcticum]PXA68457.1 transposase [Cryobacterium arcticum]
MVDSLAALARELYGLQPAEFTAARNARAQEFKTTDVTLAKQIGALRKPSPAAWVVNLLAREDDDGLESLLQLGEQMRDAQEQLDREALRRLGGERRTAVAALARAGADLAARLGHPPTPAVLGEVEQTLQAATSDEAAAAAVSSGLLVKALLAVGFEPVDLDDAVAVPDAPQARERRTSPATPPKSPVQLADVRRRKEAKREAERLERDADAATAELAALDRRAERLALRRSSLEAEISDLREQLRTAETALVAVDRDAGTLADDRKQAEAAAENSASRAAEARAAADALELSD